MLDAPSAELQAGRPSSFPVTVRAAVEAAAGVALFTLVTPDERPLPPWEPGAHIDVHTPAGTRQYSLCGDPDERRAYQIAVLRAPRGRGGSRYLHDVVQAGDTLVVGAPRNQFALEPAPRYAFVAGGIGITPLLPMLAELRRRAADWTLSYGGRTRASMAFLDRLAGYGDRITLHPEDTAGRLDLDAALAVPEGTRVYACGPAGMLADIEDRLRHQPDCRLHTERFNAVSATGTGGTPFVVRCSQSGLDVEVGSDESMLDALLRAGFELNYDCRQGTCGACELDVVAGEPLHRDVAMTDEQRRAEQVVFPCVSRSNSPVLSVDL